jgi:hypothetical protein
VEGRVPRWEAILDHHLGPQCDPRGPRKEEGELVREGVAMDVGVWVSRDLNQGTVGKGRVCLQRPPPTPPPQVPSLSHLGVSPDSHFSPLLSTLKVRLCHLSLGPHHLSQKWGDWGFPYPVDRSSCQSQHWSLSSTAHGVSHIGGRKPRSCRETGTGYPPPSPTPRACLSTAGLPSPWVVLQDRHKHSALSWLN